MPIQSSCLAMHLPSCTTAAHSSSSSRRAICQHVRVLRGSLHCVRSFPRHQVFVQRQQQQKHQQGHAPQHASVRCTAAADPTAAPTEDEDAFDSQLTCSPAFVTVDQSNPHYSAFNIDVSSCMLTTATLCTAAGHVMTHYDSSRRVPVLLLLWVVAM